MTDAEARATIWMRKELEEDLDENYINFRYDSRSHWIREAIYYRMALEDALDRRGIELPEDDEERRATIEDLAVASAATFAANSDK